MFMPSLNAYQTSMGELIKNSNQAIVGEIYCVNISFHTSDRLFRQSKRRLKNQPSFLFNINLCYDIKYVEVEGVIVVLNHEAPTTRSKTGDYDLAVLINACGLNILRVGSVLNVA